MKEFKMDKENKTKKVWKCSYYIEILRHPTQEHNWRHARILNHATSENF